MLAEGWVGISGRSADPGHLPLVTIPYKSTHLPPAVASCRALEDGTLEAQYFRFVWYMKLSSGTTLATGYVHGNVDFIAMS